MDSTVAFAKSDWVSRDRLSSVDGSRGLCITRRKRPVAYGGSDGQSTFRCGPTGKVLHSGIRQNSQTFPIETLKMPKIQLAGSRRNNTMNIR